MVLKSAVPVLLLLLGSAGCRAPEPEPPAVAVTVAEPVPEELRLYAVADILEHLDGVPKRGFCVLPIPATGRVTLLRSWSVPELVALLESPDPPVAGGSSGGVREGDSGFLSPGDRSALLEMTVLLLQDAQVQAVPSIKAAGRKRSSTIEEPDEALLQHIRSRLAATEGEPGACRLTVRGGTTLKARGTPAAMAAVERALAELR